jgi:glycosyltransferase involved in cell wall biosynthesis
MERHGGVGGQQRSTHAFLRYFRSRNCQVDLIYAKEAEPGPHSLRPEEGLALYSAQERKFKLVLSDYHILYAHPFHYRRFGLEKIVRHFPGIKILNWQKPAMDTLKNYRISFDLIHSEIPCAHRLPVKGFTCPAPMEETESEESPLSEKPFVEPYFLTVFNPYGPIKGLSHLLGTLDRLDRPLVWCYDLRSFWHYPDLMRDIKKQIEQVRHPRLITVEAPSPDYIRLLYRHCLGYLCFSEFESFGWSLVDAIRQGCPVAAREVGLLRLVKKFRPLTNAGPVSFNRITGEWTSCDFFDRLRTQLEGRASPPVLNFEAQEVSF